MTRGPGVVVMAFALMTTVAQAATVDDVFNAIAIDNLRTVRQLVGDPVYRPDLRDKQGDTPLIAAIRNDAPQVTRFLLEQKSTDPEATNVSNETPLMLAAYRKQTATVDLLLARDVEVNRTGWTALHYAASVGAGDIVTILLDHAAYIDAESPNRTTPLMMAARGGFEAVCRQLIDAGADPTPINERDVDAAGFARKAGNDDLAQWLDARSTAWRAKYGIPIKRPASGR